MKGNYKAGIVVLLYLIIITTSASAITEIGDNITVVNNVTAQNFIGNLNWAYLLGIPTDFPNSTIASYSGNFPNSSLPNYLLISTYGTNFPNSTIGTYNGDFPNNTVSSKTTLAQVNSSAQIGESQVTNLVTDLGNKLNIATYGSNFPNSTIGTYNGDFPNSTVSSKTTLSQVNSSAQIGESQVTNLVTDLGNKLNTATYGSNFPNSTIGTYSGDFPNSSVSTKTTLSQVNSSAQIGESQVTGLVTDLGNKLNTATYGSNFPNSTIGTYSGDFPNSSLPNYLLISTYGTNFPNSTIGTYNGDFPNSTVSSKTTLSQVNSSAQIEESQVTNLVTDLGNKLNIATYGSNFPNSTIGTYNGDFPNSTVSSKTTLAQVNSSAQIGESQVTNLVTDLGNKLNIATYGSNFPNSTIGSYSGDFPNSSLPNYLLISTYGANFPNNTLASYSGDFPNSSSLKSVLGTANRINVTGNTIDIATNWIGQAAITTLGSITTGTWQGTVIADAYIESANIWNAKTTLAQVNQSANLYNVNGSNITSGTITKNVLPANVTYNDSANTFGSFNQIFDTNTLFIDAVNHRVGIGTASPGNKLDVIGTVNASFLNGNGTGISGVNASNITSGQIPSVSRLPAGTMIFLGGDDTLVTGSATNTAAKTYSLGANSYSYIIAEAEINVTGPANALYEWKFDLIDGTTVVDSFNMAAKINEGVIGPKFSASLKAFFVENTAKTISVSVTSVTAQGSWGVRSLRVYGVV